MTTYPTTPEAPVTRAEIERLRSRLEGAREIIAGLWREVGTGVKYYNDWPEFQDLVNQAGEWLKLEEEPCH